MRINFARGRGGEGGDVFGGGCGGGRAWDRQRFLAIGDRVLGSHLSYPLFPNG